MKSISNGRRLVHHYKRVKINKCDSQYLNSAPIPSGSFLTERVKIEKYQGYSNAYNLCEYFRLRGNTSWKSGVQLTGLWKTGRDGVYRGDYKRDGKKTLILFKFSENREVLTVVVFPFGYYPTNEQLTKVILSV